jgi:hypothetical protein
MSRRARIRKRKRKQSQYAQRPRQVDKPISRVKTAGLFGAVLARQAFDEALLETQHTV